MSTIISRLLSMFTGGGRRTRSRSTGRGGLLSRLFSMFSGRSRTRV